MKYHIFLSFLAVAAAYPGLVHEEPHEEEKIDHKAISESEHEQHVEHEFAKSHQSIKIEHFHPVPVYIKKEHSHLLKHPLEKGKHEHKLQQVHPETEHHHGGGLILEDERLDIEHHPDFDGGHEDWGNFDVSEALKGHEEHHHEEYHHEEPHEEHHEHHEPEHHGHEHHGHEHHGHEHHGHEHHGHEHHGHEHHGGEGEGYHFGGY